MTATVRFDDLRPRHRRGFALGPIKETIAAYTDADVPLALAEAERAVATGHWVGGWISYEASPAFDPALVTRDRGATAFSELPLVWLAVSGRRTKTPSIEVASHRLAPWEPITPPSHHQRAVEAIHRRIELGDTYQVNHTFLLESRFEGSVPGFYDRLIRAQSCGYGTLIETDRWAVVSASPELFFEWRNGQILCRPMKGTVRRGADNEEDATLRSWLAGSEKNRAENVMIVDMVRNDLGRIARIGSVRVPELFTLEKYDTVWQMTSTITAKPRAEAGLVDIFRALFPSASITGAPKVSTMAIIADLETHPRGVYCGAIGFGGPGPEGPEWAFNVGIRTVVIDRRTSAAFYGIGGGITYDSEPADEYNEALLKAEVLTRANDALALLETSRWDPQLGIRHLDRHLARAELSAAYFDIPFDAAEVRSALFRALKERCDPAQIRFTIDRRGWVSVELSDLVTTMVPVRLALDDRPVSRRDPFLRHKTTIRSTYQQAANRHPGADDVILWNEDSQITETTIGNLAFEIDGHWVTPPVDCGLLAGTERAARLASGELIEAIVRLHDLGSVTAVARLNSVRGWEEARLI